MSLPMAPGTYQIDPVHSQLGFSVTHLGISVVRGSFDRFDGTLSVGDDLAATSVALDAEIASMNSGNEARNEVMLGEDWLDAASHPMLSFRSTSISTNGDGYHLGGDLTLRGTTNPIVLAVLYNGAADFPFDGKTHHGFSANGQISRSAFGVSIGVPMVTDEVVLQLEAQFIPAD